MRKSDFRVKAQTLLKRLGFPTFGHHVQGKMSEAIASLPLWGGHLKTIIRLLKHVAEHTSDSNSTGKGGSSDIGSQMNQGDFHSGPSGYSENTAYPETQYGSNFDEGADWNNS